MHFTTAVQTVFFKKYATFKGRALRSEYWWWTLAIILIATAAQIVDISFLATQVHMMRGPGAFSVEHNGPLSTIVTLATIIPNLAVTVRRLHDSDMSGWWFFIVFVPLLGMLFFLYLLIRRGTDGPNRFGPDPLDPTSNLQQDWQRGTSDAPAQHEGRRYRGLPRDEDAVPDDRMSEDIVEDEASGRRPPSNPEPEPKPEPRVKDTAPSRPSWRTPSTRKDGFQTTQERFKDK